MNVLLIITDQQSKRYLGCYGNEYVDTPHRDALAGKGVRFTRAYCSSPICAPTRASLISGQYVHEIGCWDNAHPYHGNSANWGQFLQNNGITFTSIGRNDFHPSAKVIADERLGGWREHPDIVGLYRDEVVERGAERPWREKAGVELIGDPADESDHNVALAAAQWLQEEAAAQQEPWCLWVNFERPHSPYCCREELFKKYSPRAEKLDEISDHSCDNLHPLNEALLLHGCGGSQVSRETNLRARAGYMGLCEQVDENVGLVLSALTQSGRNEDTLIICTSDHGEMMGAHGLWEKFSLYEESAGIPLIISGPGIRQGAVENYPVGQLDIFPTIAEAVGLTPPEEFRGRSLLGLARTGERSEDPAYAFSEYHANGSVTGAFMICDGRWKAVFSPKYKPMLFDLENDPLEKHDLAATETENHEIQLVLLRLRQELDNICDMDAVDRRAKADQRTMRDVLQAAGRLEHEVEIRGFKLDGERLINTI